MANNNNENKPEISLSEEDVEQLDRVGWLTSMMLVLLGNYAQTGHLGGPLSYTPANVVLHLGGADNGGLAFDIRNPKHPLTDKYMLAGGHCAPTNYGLWMVLYQAMAKQFEETKDEKYKVDKDIAMLPVDALGFRRSPGAVATLLADNELEDNELFSGAKDRGIRALMGHTETTDVTNDVNGGPSGIGVANTAGKALYWDKIGAPEDLKVHVFEGEFAFTEGHAQELKTVALAQKVGKRMRLFFSYNNAGIDDALVNGVVDKKFEDSYDMCNQFSSYGWNVFHLKNGASYNDLLQTFRQIEEWDNNDKRPVVIVAETIKGWWPGAKDGKIDGGEKPSHTQGHKSHPYNIPTNSPYFIALAESFESHFNIKFDGIRDGKPATEKERLIQFKTNIDRVMSVMEQDDGKLRKWICDRLLTISDKFYESRSNDEWKQVLTNFKSGQDLYLDDRLKPENLPLDTQTVTMVHPDTGETIEKTISLFLPAGTKKGARRSISEIGKWCNYVTNNRWVTIAADLSGSINVEDANFTGHYDPENNPSGTRLKAGIQECCNAATMCGLASQTISQNPEVHSGWWGVSGTYGAFTPLMYTPMRIFSQQNQDSPFKLGVVTIIAGHSGPETAADGRSHFGVFAPQCWKLFPKNQIINLHFWDYNDVAPGYFQAIQIANKVKETGIIVIHVARPDVPTVDRNILADTDPLAAAKGCYLIREFDENLPKCGTIFVQGSSSTVNIIKLLPTLDEEKLNVRIVYVVSQELFSHQSQEYQDFIIPDDQLLDSTFITTFTKRVPPISNLGPLALEYSLSSDHDDRWRTGGLEKDIITEAHLDEPHILDSIRKFVNERDQRISRLTAALKLLQ
eukprot:TRINITY_DN907_c0_g1_i1.p1 TRINITY_DN907_c0_g1~~TRINITY_DN907_c0_g1_i1.p1  ORF type:complete len:853 (-),score=396.56 TRINITY_DN907_c0_g1_i1:49-2607(-)